MSEEMHINYIHNKIKYKRKNPIKTEFNKYTKNVLEGGLPIY